jgi:hypothetical protein
VSSGWCWFWFTTPAPFSKERAEVVLFTSSLLVSMVMIVVREYIHGEARDREAIIVT